MKLSKNFLKDYIDIDVDINTLAEDMTKVGNEYDEVGKLIKANNLIIGKVTQCMEHPDSDHLHVCKVDIGEETLQIVCGAPNVRLGIKVIVALPGAELPGGTIKKGIIRGQESNGMICSIAELGIESKFLKPEDKDGIHELSINAPIGEDPIKYMELDDEVIDFDLTTNRGDLLSILGMAYEVGAIYDKQVKDIDLSHSEIEENINDSFTLAINTENCTMFLAKKVKNVTIKESPLFIKNRLIASGIRPINNVVDISNYVMLETGQPLHFYDADTLNGVLEVRMAGENERLVTLDNIERRLTVDDIVISDGRRSIGLAGVMGGLDTEITDNTKNIIIESAIFDSVKVRKTSQKIIRSEASNRFEKGLDPNRTYMAIERACTLLEKYADATIVGGMAEHNKEVLENKIVEIKVKDINNLLGTNLVLGEALEIFRRLGFESSVNGEIIKVCVPKRRLDISIKEDLIEEVGRIYGVDNVKGRLPEMPIKAGSYDRVTREIRNKMINLGLNETLSYILVNEKEAKNYTNDDAEAIKLLSPLSEDRNTLRHSIIPSLYKIYEYNSSHYNKDVSIFEIGKTFFKKGEEYSEENCVSALLSGDYFLGVKKTAVDFYVVKGIVEELLDYLGYGGRYSFIVKENIPEQLHPGQSAFISVNNDIVGIIGRIHPNVKKDISIIVNKDMESSEVAMQIKKVAGSLLIKSEIFDVYTGEGIDKDKKSLSYSLTFEANDRTLTDEEINGILDKIIEKISKIGEIRGK